MTVPTVSSLLIFAPLAKQQTARDPDPGRLV